MKITTFTYSLERTNFAEYEIYNLSQTAASLYYTIYQVFDTKLKIVQEAIVLVAGRNETYTFTTEGMYIFEIVHTDEGGVGTVITQYDIRYFPTLKDSIITTMQRLICNCPTAPAQTNCIIGAVSPIAQDLYDLQLVINSIGYYRDLLLSSHFTRNYQYALTTTMDSNSVKLMSLLNSAYVAVTTRGEAEDSVYLLRMYVAYLYMLFYIIEINLSQYEVDENGDEPAAVPFAISGLYPDDNDTDEVAAIKERFNFNVVDDCYNALGLNVFDIYTTLGDLYVTCGMGVGCGTTSGGTPVLDPTSNFAISMALTAESNLITHNRLKLCNEAFYYDDNGWRQPLSVNNEETGDDLNAVWVFAGKVVSERFIYLTFVNL